MKVPITSCASSTLPRLVQPAVGGCAGLRTGVSEKGQPRGDLGALLQGDQQPRCHGPSEDRSPPSGQLRSLLSGCPSSTCPSSPGPERRELQLPAGVSVSTSQSCPPPPPPSRKGWTPHCRTCDRRQIPLYPRHVTRGQPPHCRAPGSLTA